MQSAFDVVAEPNRRRILDLLRQKECSVGELVTALALPQPSVSKHLKVLRANQFVRARIHGQHRVYRLDPAPLMELDAWLEPYRSLWNARLDALGRHLDRTSAEASSGMPATWAISAPAGPERRAPRRAPRSSKLNSERRTRER